MLRNLCADLFGVWDNKLNKKHLKNVGPIHYCEPPHAHSPGVASSTVAHRLRIDVHDANDNDDNDNTWQRGPLWLHGMGPIKTPPYFVAPRYRAESCSKNDTCCSWHNRFTFVKIAPDKTVNFDYVVILRRDRETVMRLNVIGNFSTRR